jgi:hypothetical protein
MSNAPQIVCETLRYSTGEQKIAAMKNIFLEALSFQEDILMTSLIKG